MDAIEKIFCSGLIRPDACAGWALRTRRRLAGLRQVELARLIGVARQRLSASESGDWYRGLDHQSLMRAEDALGASGQLSDLRDRLHRLSSPVASRTLLSAREIFDLNHQVRIGVPVDRGKALYVDAVELARSGLDMANDRRAQGTLAAIADELQRRSTTDNYYLAGAIGVFGEAAGGVLQDLLLDPQNISPWRALEVLPSATRETSATQHLLLKFLDGQGMFGDDVKRHRAVIDALYQLGAPLPSVRYLYEITAESRCFPEARVGALIMSCGRLSADKDAARRRRHLKNLRDTATVLTATADHALRATEDGELPPPMYRFGRDLEGRLLELIKEDQVIRVDAVAIRLMCELFCTVHETERRFAGQALRAAGLSAPVSRIFEEVFVAATTDAKGMIARNCLSHLKDNQSATFLLQNRTDSDPILRAHLAWALGRFPEPTLTQSLALWLEDEIRAKSQHPDVIAALSQFVRNK